MSHVVLLGDSIFDNRAYVAPEPDVVHQLRSRLRSGWSATLFAVDRHVTEDVVARQLDRLPDDASHLAVSVGGNDALGCSFVLNELARLVAEAVGRLAQAQRTFAKGYTRMVDAVLDRGLPVALCTIYDANYPEPRRQLAIAGLTLFNDVILRAAFTHRLPLVDLRLICNEPADYANPIEPSSRGGDKIAAAITALVKADVPWPERSAVWIG